MPSYCVAYGCTNDSARTGTRILSFHTFPFKRPEILQLWIRAISRDNWTPSKFSRICGEHFLSTDYVVRPGLTAKLLKPDAVPSIFSFSKHLLARVDKPHRAIVKHEMPVLKKCAVFGCLPSPDDHCHNFSRNEEVGKIWLTVINNLALRDLPYHRIKRNYYVCSKHFDTSQFQTAKRIKLNRQAIPSRNLLSQRVAPVCSLEPIQSDSDTFHDVGATSTGIKDKNEIESTENEMNTVPYIKDECEFMELHENEIKDEVVSDNEPEEELDIVLERPLGDDIFRVCRTCLKIAKVEDTIPLVAHGPGSKTELYKRLTGFLGSDIFSVENPCICINCERFMNAVHDFKMTFNANEMVLMEFDWGKKTKDLLHIVDQDTLKNMYNESCRESDKVSLCTTLQDNVAHSTKEDIELDWVDKWKELDEKGNGLSDMEDYWYPTDETKLSDHDYASLETTNPASYLLKDNIDIFSPIFDGYLRKVGGRTTERLRKKIRRFHINDEGYGPFICEFCGKVISSKVLFTRHCSKHKLRDGFQCEICSKVLPEWDSYKNHCKLLHGGLPKRFECPSCNKKYRTRKLLESHIQIHKIEDSKYSCLICREAFESKVDFEKHRIVHRPQKGFCKICGLGFFKNDLRRHMMLKHVLSDVSGLKNVKKLFVCDLCGKKYFKEGSLKLHKKHCKDNDSSGSPKNREQQFQDEDEEQDVIIENYEVIANETKDSVQILIYDD